MHVTQLLAGVCCGCQGNAVYNTHKDTPSHAQYLWQTISHGESGKFGLCQEALLCHCCRVLEESRAKVEQLRQQRAMASMADAPEDGGKGGAGKKKRKKGANEDMGDFYVDDAQPIERLPKAKRTNEDVQVGACMADSMGGLRHKALLWHLASLLLAVYDFMEWSFQMPARRGQHMVFLSALNPLPATRGGISISISFVCTALDVQ